MRRRKLGRRAFLGGATVALGLPFLPSVMSLHGLKAARGQTATGAPLRFLVYYVPNGVYLGGPAPARIPDAPAQPGAWMPTGVGDDYTLSEILEPLDPVRSDLMVVSGLTNSPGVPPSQNGAHAGGMAALLTCRPYLKDGNINLGRSVDQRIADQIGQDTVLRSLELGIPDQSNPDGPGIFHENISWLDESTPAPPITDPQLAFDRLFAGFDPTAAAGEVERRRLYRTSVLDGVLEDAGSLLPRLDAEDRRKLDGYLTAIRDVESSIQKSPASGACTLPDGLDRVNDEFPSILNMHHQLITLAFQCDATRVISLMLGQGLGGRPYPWAGVNGDGHAVTHHGPDQDAIAAQKRIDIWRVQQLVGLVEQLKGITDVDGNSVLHNTLIYYTSEIADGDRHNQENKAILLAGQFGGNIRTGRHLQFPEGHVGDYLPCDETSTDGCQQPALGDLYLTLMRMAGIEATTFGDTGKGVFTNLG